MTIKKDAALEKLLSRQVTEIRLIAGEQIPIRQLPGLVFSQDDVDALFDAI